MYGFGLFDMNIPDTVAFVRVRVCIQSDGNTCDNDSRPLYCFLSLDLNGFMLFFRPISTSFPLTPAQALDLPAPVIYSGKFLLSWPLTYHFLNGIRHLVWLQFAVYVDIASIAVCACVCRGGM